MKRAGKRRLPPASVVLAKAAKTLKANSCPTEPKLYEPPGSDESSHIIIQRLQRSWSQFLHSDCAVQLVFETAEREKERSQVIVEFKKILAEVAGHQVVIEAFGSVRQRLALPASDVDLNVASEDAEFFAKLRSRLLQLSPDRIYQIRVVAGARVPLLSCSFDGVQFDVTRQCGGTEMEHHRDIIDFISAYTNTSAALFPALKFIKAWALRWGLASAHRNSLPSLAFVVMLFSVFDRASADIDTVALVFEFFRYFATVNLGTTLIVATRSSSARYLGDQRALATISAFSAAARDPGGVGFGQNMFVVDPALPDVNLGRFVIDSSRRRLVSAFRLSLKILSDESESKPFDKLLQPPPNKNNL